MELSSVLKKYRILVLFYLHILIIIVKNFIENYLDISFPKSSFKDNYEEDYIGLLVLGVIVSPLMEEVAYRYPLKKRKYIYISLVWGIIFSFIGGFNIYITAFNIGVFLFAFVNYFILKRKELYNIHFWAFVLAFTLIHTINYDSIYLTDLSIYSIILFFPQLLLGGILTYIRVKYRFLYSLLYHAMYNLILIILFIISKEF